MLAKLTQAALYATNTEVKEYLKTGTTIDKLSFEYPGDKCCTLYVGYDFKGSKEHSAIPKEVTTLPSTSKT